MKNLFVIPTILFLCIQAYANVNVSLTGTAAPENAVIAQTNFGGTELQVRNLQNNLTDFRGASQTFQWNSNGALTGLAVRLSANQTDLWENQNYELIFQSVNHQTGAVSGLVVALDFVLDGTMIKDAGGQWLMLELTNPVALTQGNWYGFTLSPTRDNASVSSQRLRLSTSDSGDSYIGAGAQFGGGSALPLNNYDVTGTNWNDITFAMTAQIPEAGNTVLLIGALVPVLLLARRVSRRRIG